MEHLHDIMALQINNFNSFFNSCNNLRGLSDMDNILRIIVSSKYHLPYIWHNDCKAGVSDYGPPKLRTVIIYTCTWLCERDSKGGHCSAECVDSSII